jgi:hypothetical protein
MTGRGFGTGGIFCHLDKTEVGRKRKIARANHFQVLPSTFSFPRVISYTPLPLSSLSPCPLSHTSPTHPPQAALNTHFRIDQNERARTKTVDDRTQAEEVIGAQSAIERGSRSATDKSERGQRKVRTNYGSLIRMDRSLTRIFTSLIRYCKTTTDHLVSPQGYLMAAGSPYRRSGTVSYRSALVLCTILVPSTRLHLVLIGFRSPTTFCSLSRRYRLFGDLSTRQKTRTHLRQRDATVS